MQHGDEVQTEVHTGRSVWQARNILPLECPPPDQSIQCHTAVIGAGITGALVSHLLTKEGVDTVLLDQGVIGAGSTAFSTGLLQYEVDTPLVDLLGLVGETAALRAFRQGLTAVRKLKEICAGLGEQCEFADRIALCLASRPKHLADLQREHECRRHFGFDVSLFDRAGLAEFCGLEAPGALLSHGDAEINPYQFTQSLVHASRTGGLRAFGHTRVQDLNHDGASHVLLTETGPIVAQHVVFATGYFAQPSLPSSVSTLRTTYAMASQPLQNIPRWPEECLIWETARPYFYLRRTRDGRAIIGGEDSGYRNDHKDQTLLDVKAARLKTRFDSLFPETPYQPAFVWAGSFAETRDGLPYIGRVPGCPRCYLALGYGGNGITFSMIAAELIRDLILGRPNEDEAIFRLGR